MVFGRGVVGPYFEFQDLRFFLLAFACPRVPRAHHLARRATLLLSITNRPPPPLSFSCFTLGDLRLRPGIVPTLTLTFNKNQRAPSLFSSPRFTRVRLSRLARSSQRTSHIANSPTRPAIRTRSPPFLPPNSDPRHTPPPCSHVRQAAPLFSPSSTCLVLLFSQVHLIVLFCLGSTRLPAITDGADQTTDGCGVVGISDIRSRSTSTTSSGRDGGGRHLPFHAQPPKLIPRFSSCWGLS